MANHTALRRSSSQLDMLAAVVDGTVDEQRFGVADRLTYASLVNSGLLIESPDGPSLGEAALTELGRDDDVPA